MISREELLATLAIIKAQASARYGIRSLALFGSRARGDACATSDVDVLIDIDPRVGLGFVDLAETMEQRLGLHVDLISTRALAPRHRKAIEADLVYV
jgi:hypothetical protein